MRSSRLERADGQARSVHLLARHAVARLAQDQARPAAAPATLSGRDREARVFSAACLGDHAECNPYSQGVAGRRRRRTPTQRAPSWHGVCRLSAECRREKCGVGIQFARATGCVGVHARSPRRTSWHDANWYAMGFVEVWTIESVNACACPPPQRRPSSPPPHG